MGATSDWLMNVRLIDFIGSWYLAGGEARLSLLGDTSDWLVDASSADSFIWELVLSGGEVQLGATSDRLMTVQWIHLIGSWY